MRAHHTALFGDKDTVRDYFVKRNRCEWRRVDIRKRNFMFAHFDAAEYADESWLHFSMGVDVDAANVSHVLEVCKHGDLSIERVGPFYSFGGSDWSRFQFEHVGDFSDSAVQLSVTRASILLLDERGNTLTNPPLNPHHVHMNTPFGMYPYRHGSWPSIHPSMQAQEGHLIHQVHGDSSCHSSGASAGCLFVRLPPHAGFPLLRNEVAIVAEIQDVRRPGAAGLVFWLEISLTTARTATLRPSYMWMFEDYPWVTPFSLETLKFVTQRVGSGHSLHWKTRRLKKCLRFHGGWFHTHHTWTSDMWLFRGTPFQLGLNDAAPYIRNAWWQMIDLTAHGLSHLDAQRHIQDTAGSANASFLCSLPDQCDRFEFVRADTTHPAIVEGWYYRSPQHAACSDFTATAGESLTLVAFYNPIFETERRKHYLQHDQFQAYVTHQCQ